MFAFVFTNCVLAESIHDTGNVEHNVCAEHCSYLNIVVVPNTQVDGKPSGCTWPLCLNVEPYVLRLSLETKILNSS